MSDQPSHLGDDLGVNVGIVAGMGEEPRPAVEDHRRVAPRGEPPVPGAQWDELHQRWEAWDDATETWLVVGDDPGRVAPADENPLPSVLARSERLVDDLDTERVEAPERRQAEPDDAPRGAQWNEVAGRWERWDEGADAWVEAAHDDDDAPTDDPPTG